jgi:AmiR/NasT family two-component response regulator
MGCTADEAFVLLKKQSQAENRKLTEIAADIVARAQRRR